MFSPFHARNVPCLFQHVERGSAIRAFVESLVVGRERSLPGDRGRSTWQKSNLQDLRRLHHLRIMG